MKFKNLSDRIKALDLPGSEDEEKRRERIEQGAFENFIEANMTLKEHRQYHEWLLKPKSKDSEIIPWPPAFLAASERARTDPIVDPKLFESKYLRLEEMRTSPAMLRLFSDEEGREIHALNSWFQGFFH